METFHRSKACAHGCWILYGARDSDVSNAQAEALDAHVPAAQVAAGPPPGYLYIGTTGRGEVVINHPDLHADERGVGHIIFSSAEARALAELLQRKASEADAE